PTDEATCLYGAVTHVTSGQPAHPLAIPTLPHRIHVRISHAHFSPVVRAAPPRAEPRSIGQHRLRRTVASARCRAAAHRHDDHRRRHARRARLAPRCAPHRILRISPRRRI